MPRPSDERQRREKFAAAQLRSIDRLTTLLRAAQLTIKQLHQRNAELQLQVQQPTHQGSRQDRGSASAMAMQPASPIGLEPRLNRRSTFAQGALHASLLSLSRLSFSLSFSKQRG